MNQIFLNYKKFFFSFFSILSIIGYGYFVYAAAPSGGYNPGQILDPDCAPGDVDCVVKLQTSGGGSPAGSDTQIQYNNAGSFGADALATRDAVTKVSQIFRPFSYASAYTFDIDTVPAAIVPSNEPFIDGESLTFYEYAASSIAFSGTGIDDLSNSTSNFYGTYPTTYTVTVASSGTPDTFDWTDGTNSGTGVSMSTSSIPLSNGVEISFGSDKFHIPGDSWSWTYSSNSVGTATLIHQEVGSPFIFQFYSSVTGTPDIANYVVGATSGATVDVAQYFSNSTFTASESVFSVSTDYVVSPMATITSVPGADNYIIAGASGFGQYSILANEDDGKYGGIISSTSTPIVSNAQAGFITNDNILGLGVDGSGILFDNTDNSDYGFTGIFNQNGISGGIRLNQEGTTTTLDLSKTGLLFNLNNGLVTSNFAIDTQNISLYVTDPSNSGTIGISADAIADTMQIGGGNSRIDIDNNQEKLTLRGNNGLDPVKITLDGTTNKINFFDRYTFPNSPGTTGQVLALDGSGNLEWTTSGAVWNSITGTQSDVNVSGFTNDSGYLTSISGLNISQLTNDSGYITSSALSSYVPTSRTLTINGTGYDLSANRSWTIPTSPITIGTSGNTLYSSGLTGTGEGGSSGNNIILGVNAGSGASFAQGSNFIGYETGRFATSSQFSNFIGYGAGRGAITSYNSNFIGYEAGNGATLSTLSSFIGNQAGYQATGARNSIFIGSYSGKNDTVTNGNLDYSIAIGDFSGTGGYSNSIALGGHATNTASNQFMIGSVTRPITSMVLTGDYSGGSCTFAVGGMSCSSDERLKTNIEDLQSSTLDTVINIRTVHYNWNGSSDGPKQVGFIAQDLQQYFPELVSMGQGGYLQVNYAQMTPILVQAIREMNLKITTINDMTTPNTWRDSLIAWFGNIENGITDFFAKRVTTDELCVGTVCVTQDQFLQMVQQSGQIPVVQTPSPDPQPADTPTEDTSSDQSVTDTVSPSDTPAPTENTDIETSDTPPSDSSSDTPSDSGIDTETAL